MILYVCWNAKQGPLGHACGDANRALREAGHNPEVVKSYGQGHLPDAIFNRSAGRRKVKEMTGDSMVPVLVTNDDKWVQGSKNIIAWAAENPAR